MKQLLEAMFVKQGLGMPEQKVLKDSCQNL